MSINVKSTTTNKRTQATSSKPSGAAKSSKGSNASKSSNSNTANEDSIQLTDTAAKLQQIEQSLSDIPIVDNARVDAISQSIDDGQYQINDHKIADRIIQTETDINKLKK